MICYTGLGLMQAMCVFYVAQNFIVVYALNCKYILPKRTVTSEVTPKTLWLTFMTRIIPGPEPLEVGGAATSNWLMHLSAVTWLYVCIFWIVSSLQVFQPATVCTIFPPHLSLQLIILIIILMNSTVMKPLINSFIACGILLDTFNLCFFHNVRDQVSLS
jgi:hypothetical protein